MRLCKNAKFFHLYVNCIPKPELGNEGKYLLKHIYTLLPKLRLGKDSGENFLFLHRHGSIKIYFPAGAVCFKGGAAFGETCFFTQSSVTDFGLISGRFSARYHIACAQSPSARDTENSTV